MSLTNCIDIQFLCTVIIIALRVSQTDDLDLVHGHARRALVDSRDQPTSVKTKYATFVSRERSEHWTSATQPVWWDRWIQGESQVRSTLYLGFLNERERLESNLSIGAEGWGGWVTSRPYNYTARVLRSPTERVLAVSRSFLNPVSESGCPLCGVEWYRCGRRSPRIFDDSGASGSINRFSFGQDGRELSRGSSLDSTYKTTHTPTTNVS